MSVPAIANLPVNRRPTECGHPMDHLTSPDPPIWVDPDGGLGCVHGTVGVDDRRWREKRNEFVCDIFKEALWCLGTYGIEGLRDPATVRRDAA